MKQLVKISAISLLLVQLFGCHKVDEPTDPEGSVEEVSVEEQILALPHKEFEDPELITLYSESMKEVLTMAQDQQFRNFMFASALENDKKGQDYDVNFGAIIKSHKNSLKLGKAVSKLEVLSAKIQSHGTGEIPMVFFPRAETLEDQVKANKTFDTSKAMKEPIAVMKGAYNDDYSVPGYKLGSDGELKYIGDINEEFAWNNDVYVIGKSENITEYSRRCENMQKGSDCYSGGGPSGNTSRNRRKDGRAERGGLIQVLALNEIEHWTAGKLEFRLIVSGLRTSSGTVTNDIKFPKTKRKHFKNKKWYDFNVFLFNWNLSNLADYNIEKWMERDNGLMESSLEISIPGSAYKPATSTTPAQPALPGTKVSIKYRRGDEDLGSSLIQFSDKIDQVYNLGQANIKRK